MPIPEVHKKFLQEIDSTFMESVYLGTLLTNGGHLPAYQVPNTVWMMPGQCLSSDYSKIKSGPVEHRRYMVVAVAPDGVDHRQQQHLMSNAGMLLKKALSDAQIPMDEVYFTTVTKFPKPLSASSYSQRWLQTGWEYVLEEFNRVKPQAILFLGAEVAKCGFGKKTKMENVRGQVQPFGTDAHECQALAANSHLAFVSNAAGLGVLTKQLEVFKEMGHKQVQSLDGVNYADRDYKVLWTAEEIQSEIELEIAAGHKFFAIDVETGTDTGHPEDDYVVSFQWSHGPGHARIIPMLVERAEPIIQDTVKRGKRRGEPIFETVSRWVSDEAPPEGVAIHTDPETGLEYWAKDQPKMVAQYEGAGVDRKCRDDKVAHWEFARQKIIRLLTWSDDTCLMGHNVRYDLHCMRDDLGLDIRQFCNGSRSWDTMLACHLLGKEDSFGLKEQTLKHTNMGAYDAPMQAWVSANSGSGKLFPGEETDRFFCGYRDIAYKYLLPYGMCDVDATFRLYYVYNAVLEQPQNARLKQLFYEVELPVMHPLIDVESYGMPADEDRLKELGDMYADKYQSLIEELRDTINWPDFNPASNVHMPALLYHPPYKDSDKLTDPTKWKKKGVPPVPDDALRLGLTPILTTGKYPKKWEEVVAMGQEAYHGASCAEGTLKQLKATYHDMHEDKVKILDLLIDICALKQFVTLFLREPDWDTPVETGKPRYGKGLRGCINSKGRICTSISTMSETGRMKHSKPNLANLPKNKEGAIEKIIGHKVPMVRSGFKSKPGWVIMECDYCSAELYIVGYMSGDPAFIEVLESGQDVHGYNAVKVFNLDCTPDEVKKKYKDKRAAVKTVVFGLIYGLSPTGLAEKLTIELGRPVPLEEANAIIQQFFSTYPGIKAFIDESRKACLVEGYVETAYGRRRYFPGVASLGPDKQAAAQREATNARIQGTVADMLNVASINLDRMLYETDIGQIIGWEYVVPIHDAILVHVREEHASIMAGILKYCMSDCVPIPGTGGRRLDIDAEAGPRWQEFESVPIAPLAA